MFNICRLSLFLSCIADSRRGLSEKDPKKIDVNHGPIGWTHRYSSIFYSFSQNVMIIRKYLIKTHFHSANRSAIYIKRWISEFFFMFSGFVFVVFLFLISFLF